MHTLNALKTYIATLALATMSLTHPAAPLTPPSPELTEYDILLAECRKEPAAANAALFDQTLASITQDWYFRTHDMATVLRVAARSGHEYFVERLLHRGVPVDARNKHNQTALHRAAQSGHAAIIRTLLAAGANHTALAKQEIETLDKTEKKKYRDVSALQYAIQGDHHEAFELLLARKTPENSNLCQRLLPNAALYGSVNIARILIDNYNVNVDYQSCTQGIALHNALSCPKKPENQVLIELLLSRRANPNILDNVNRSALFTAVQEAYYLDGKADATVELLLLYGASPLSEDETIHLTQTIGDPTAILKGPIKNAEDQIAYAKALLTSHITRDKDNPLLAYWPHAVCGEIVEYTLPPVVYREYEKKRMARSAVRVGHSTSSVHGEVSSESPSAVRNAVSRTGLEPRTIGRTTQSDNDNQNNKDDEKDNE